MIYQYFPVICENISKKSIFPNYDSSPCLNPPLFQVLLECDETTILEESPYLLDRNGERIEWPGQASLILTSLDVKCRKYHKT